MESEKGREILDDNAGQIWPRFPRQGRCQAEDVIPVLVDISDVHALVLTASNKVVPGTSFQGNQGCRIRHADSARPTAMRRDERVVRIVEQDRGKAVLIGIDPHGHNRLPVTQFEFVRTAREEFQFCGEVPHGGASKTVGVHVGP